VTLALGALAALACGRGAASAREAASAAEPHLDRFAEIDQWMRRAVMADSAFRSRASLEEAAFAPFLRDEAVAEIWIDVAGARTDRLSMRGTTLPKPAWVRIADARLRELRVAPAVTLEPAARDRPGATAVLIAREAPLEDGLRVRVTVAFVEPTAPPAR